MKEKTKIYIFGNPLLSFDSIAIKIIPELKNKFPQIDFIQKDPNENLKPDNKELVIVDTVMGIEKVKVFKDIGKIETENIYSPHDFDLAFNIKLLQKIGELEKVTIFGVPPKIKKQEAFNQLSCLIEDYLNSRSN